jgi:hypothetical protein
MSFQYYIGGCDCIIIIGSIDICTINPYMRERNDQKGLFVIKYSVAMVVVSMVF